MSTRARRNKKIFVGGGGKVAEHKVAERKRSKGTADAAKTLVRGLLRALAVSTGDRAAKRAPGEGRRRGLVGMANCSNAPLLGERRFRRHGHPLMSGELAEVPDGGRWWSLGDTDGSRGDHDGSWRGLLETSQAYPTDRGGSKWMSGGRGYPIGENRPPGGRKPPPSGWNSRGPSPPTAHSREGKSKPRRCENLVRGGRMGEVRFVHIF